MQFKGQAGSVVFRSSALLPNFQVNQNWLLQFPLAPDCGRYDFLYSTKLKETHMKRKTTFILFLIVLAIFTCTTYSYSDDGNPFDKETYRQNDNPFDKETYRQGPFKYETDD